MELKYIVYITINLCNGKFYIGVHKTNPTVFDGYIGNNVYSQKTANQNTAFHRAVRKYGYENFKRTTLVTFPDTEEGRQDAYNLEAVLVNEQLLRSKSVYNMVKGGESGFQVDSNHRVYQFALNGEYLRSYMSTREAALCVDPSNAINTRAAIKNCCCAKTNSAAGYYWSYFKQFNYQNKCKKQVAQYTISGKFLRYFDSMEEAQAALHISNIEQAIRNQGSSGGYQWRYYNGNDEDISTLNNVRTKLPIKIFDKNNTLLYEYPSVKECVLNHPELKASQINRVLKGIIKTHKGFVFKYKDEDIV